MLTVYAQSTESKKSTTFWFLGEKKLSDGYKKKYIIARKNKAEFIKWDRRPKVKIFLING